MLNNRLQSDHWTNQQTIQGYSHSAIDLFKYHGHAQFSDSSSVIIHQAMTYCGFSSRWRLYREEWMIGREGATDPRSPRQTGHTQSLSLSTTLTTTKQMFEGQFTCGRNLFVRIVGRNSLSLQSALCRHWKLHALKTDYFIYLFTLLALNTLKVQSK